MYLPNATFSHNVLTKCYIFSSVLYILYFTCEMLPHTVTKCTCTTKFYLMLIVLYQMNLYCTKCWIYTSPNANFVYQMPHLYLTKCLIYQMPCLLYQMPHLYLTKCPIFTLPNAPSLPMPQLYLTKCPIFTICHMFTLPNATSLLYQIPHLYFTKSHTFTLLNPIPLLYQIP